MAFQFDGNGYISFPQWGSGTGDFSITGKFVYPAGGGFLTILGDTSGSNFILYADTGSTLKLKISSTATITGMVVGTEYNVSIVRVGSTITFTANAQSPTIAFGGTNVPWNQFGALGATQTLKFTDLISDVWTFTDDASVIWTFDFNQAPGTTNLPETTLGNDGTLNGFTSGDYDGAGTDSILITSHTDEQPLQRDNAANQVNITLSGTIGGTQPTSVEYRLDFGDWVLLDAAPTATMFTGNVTITSRQFVQVRGVGSDTISPAIAIQAVVGIVCGWQSNEQGYGINTQPVNQGAESVTPIMYNGTSFVTLADPTATVGGFGGAGGSTWPRIAKQFADNGDIVCIYNIATGGSLISQWQKPGANYDKIAPFHTLLGGLEIFTTIGGENDAQNGISQASMDTQLTALCTNVNTDFGADCYICKFPMKQPSANVATVFAAYDAVVAANAFVFTGGDLSVIDIEIATAPGNDAVHLKQDADLATAGDIRFSAFGAGLSVSSTATFTATGIIDGNYLVTIFTNSRPATLIKSEVLTFSSNSASTTIPLATATQVYAMVRDNLDPSIETAPLKTVTT